MERDVDIEMTVHIGEDFFKFMDDIYDGYCFPEDNEIYVKNKNDIIIHEMLHIFEANIRTKEAIVKLFEETHNQTLEKFIAHPEIAPIITDLLDGYKEYEHESELYAYLLQFKLSENFKSFYESIDFLCEYIEDNTGVTSFVHIYDYGEEET